MDEGDLVGTRTGSVRALSLLTVALIAGGAGVAAAAEYPPALPPCYGDSCQTPPIVVPGGNSGEQPCYGNSCAPAPVAPGDGGWTCYVDTCAPAPVVPVVENGGWDPADPYQAIEAVLVTAPRGAAGKAAPNTLANPASERPTRTGADGTGLLLALGVIAIGAGTGMAIASARARR